MTNDVPTQSNNNGTVVVPNVVGLNKDEAVNKLEESGLKYKIIFKRLQVKENNGVDLIYYDDNSVIEQSHQNGTVVIADTEVQIVINQKVSEMEYTINDDNTITLTKPGYTLYHPNKQFLIPQEYDGYKVSHIEADFFEDRLKQDAAGNIITFLIPNDITINGETTAKIVRY